MSIMNGGHAYPTLVFNGDTDQPCDQKPGMSLRDWLAGQALAGLCTGYFGDDHEGVSNEVVVKTAYAVADAMLKARSA